MTKQHDLDVKVSFQVILCNVKGIKPKVFEVIRYLKDCVDDGSISNLLDEIEINEVKDLGESKTQYT